MTANHRRLATSTSSWTSSRFFTQERNTLPVNYTNNGSKSWRLYSNHLSSNSSKNLRSTFTKLFHKSTSNRQGLVTIAKVAATTNLSKSSWSSPITKNESLLNKRRSRNCFAYGLIDN